MKTLSGLALFIAMILVIPMASPQLSEASDRTFATFGPPFPGFTESRINPIHDPRLFSGEYDDAARARGSLVGGKGFRSIDFGGAWFTRLYGTNSGGQIATGHPEAVTYHLLTANPDLSPRPDIKANSQDGPVTIRQTDNLSLSVSLDPGARSGQTADWWIAVQTPFGWYHYDATLSPWSWQPGLSVTYQGPVQALPQVEILNISNLPIGSYTFYFAVDMNMNGLLDPDSFYYDKVEVIISPSAENETVYENTTRSGPVNSNERWRGTIDITGDVTIYDPAVLTIEPGTIVRFAANSDDRAEGGNFDLRDPNYFHNDPPTLASQLSALGVYGGTLFAVGSADKPIVFTSSASTPVRGDWHCIGYHKERSKLILQNTIIEYAYQGVLINTAATNSEVTIQNNTIRHIVACGIGASTPSMLRIANNDISDCGHEAIDIGPNTTFLIENNVLHDNLWSFGDGRASVGVVINNRNSIIRNNQFIRNHCGIRFNVSGDTSISGNVFIDNDSICCGYCPVSLAIYENTTRSGIVTFDETWRGTIDITGDVIIHAPAVVTIEPGTIVRFAAASDNQAAGPTTPITNPYFPHDPPTAQSQMSSLSVYGGTLVAVGSVDKPIVFTSSGSNPTRGDWDVIDYNKEGSKLILENTIIEYAYRGIAINASADSSNVTVRNSIIRHIVACGICAGPGPPIQQRFYISGNDISDCGHEAIAGGVDNFLSIENNVLHDNCSSFGDGPAGAGVALSGNNAIIRNNQFLRNRCGISISGHPLISGNVFVGNDSDCWGDCPVPLQ